jgi:hypothetical protein
MNRERLAAALLLVQQRTCTPTVAKSTLHINFVEKHPWIIVNTRGGFKSNMRVSLENMQIRVCDTQGGCGLSRVSPLMKAAGFDVGCSLEVVLFSYTDGRKISLRAINDATVHICVEDFNAYCEQPISLDDFIQLIDVKLEKTQF